VGSNSVSECLVKWLFQTKGVIQTTPILGPDGTLYFVSNDSTNNMSIYKAQYNFYIQGNFNGIDYVDGLMYFDVQVPLTVQSYMPIQFDFSL
jgi:hypothetical protein